MSIIFKYNWEKNNIKSTKPLWGCNELDMTERLNNNKTYKFKAPDGFLGLFLDIKTIKESIIHKGINVSPFP